MESRRLLLAGIVAVALGAGCVHTRYVYVSGTQSVTVKSEHEQVKLRIEELRPEAEGTLAMKGAWSGEGQWDHFDHEADWVSLSIVREPGTGWRQHIVQGTEVVGLPIAETEDSAAPVEFKVQQPAGMLTFSGQRKGNKASGPVRFEPDETYLRQLAELMEQQPTTRQALDLMFDRVQISYVRELREAGLKVSIDELLQLNRHGIRAPYAKAMKEALPQVSVAELIRLSNSGISSDYAKSLRADGYELSADQLIKLSHSGISSGYAKAVRDAGYGSGSIEEVIRLSHSGVSSSYLQAYRSAGYAFSGEEMIKLSHGGVSSQFATTVRQAGYELSATDLIKLSNAGVSASYMTALRIPERDNLSPDEIIELSHRGINADLVRKLRK